MKKTSIVVVKMALLASPGFCAGSECPISGVKDIDLFYSQYASTAISPQFCLPSSTVEGNCDEAIAKRKNDFMISIVGDDLIAASTGLCCTNRLLIGLPLSPDRFILRPL